jgi:hypothetical protein
MKLEHNSGEATEAEKFNSTFALMNPIKLFEKKKNFNQKTNEQLKKMSIITTL